MTEKNKWCPFANSRAVSVKFPDNLIETAIFATETSSLGNDMPTTCCIGEQCSAWRVCDVERQGKVCSIGYCGLAGKP